jgi:hypothetical protein
MRHPLMAYYLATATAQERVGQAAGRRHEPVKTPRRRRSVESRRAGFRVWCDIFGHEVLIPGYDVRSVERRADGTRIEFRCACGADGVRRVGAGASPAWHQAPETTPRQLVGVD